MTFRLGAENIVLRISFAVASSVGAKSEFALFFKLLVASLCVRMVEWSGEVSGCDSVVIVLDGAICLLISSLALMILSGPVIVLDLALGRVPVPVADLAVFD